MHQPLAGRQFRRDPQQREIQSVYSLSADAALHKAPAVGSQGCLSKLNPPFLCLQQLSSPAEGDDGVQGRKHAWRHCKSALSPLLGDFGGVCWTPTHRACRSCSPETLAGSHPLLRDISYQLSRLCLHPQTDSSSPSAPTKETWSLRGEQ